MKQAIIERTFDAYYEAVWDAFTDSDNLKKWWAPIGFTCSHANLILKAGGLFHYCFENETDGKKYWGRAIYQDISEEAGKLSYFDSFADENGNPVPPSTYGLPGDEIDEHMIVFEFDDKDGTTDMKVTLENPYEGELSRQLYQGWNSMFDKLEGVLA